VSNTVSTILLSLPPRRLFHLDDSSTHASCFAPGYHPNIIPGLTCPLPVPPFAYIISKTPVLCHRLLTQESWTEMVEYGKRDGFRNEGVSDITGYLQCLVRKLSSPRTLHAESCHANTVHLTRKLLFWGSREYGWRVP
jgi:hypothetical protein